MNDNIREQLQILLHVAQGEKKYVSEKGTEERSVFLVNEIDDVLLFFWSVHLVINEA